MTENVNAYKHKTHVMYNFLRTMDWRMPCFTYSLVAKQDVNVRHDHHQGLLEELADEGRREVHAEDLVVV